MAACGRIRGFEPPKISDDKHENDSVKHSYYTEKSRSALSALWRRQIQAAPNLRLVKLGQACRHDRISDSRRYGRRHTPTQAKRHYFSSAPFSRA